LIPSIIAAVMLFAALAPWPYGYYQLLRIVVCAVGIYMAYKAYIWKRVWAIWLFGFIGLLFNPLIPVHLSREIWRPINVLCALVFVVAFILKEPGEEKQVEK